jgi:hypothetical protein
MDSVSRILVKLSTVGILQFGGIGWFPFNHSTLHLQTQSQKTEFCGVWRIDGSDFKPSTRIPNLRV